MKKIVLVACVLSIVILAGCGSDSSSQTTGADVVESENDNVVTEEYSDDTTQNDEETTYVDASELCGTWKATNGAPLVINEDGTAESTAADLTGTCEIKGNDLVIYWPETDRTETYAILESDGVISLQYGEEPLVVIYTKE